MMMSKEYTRHFKIKENFPIERGETWSVREGNRVVEKWVVDYVNDKNTMAEITVTEFEEDPNAVHFS